MHVSELIVYPVKSLRGVSLEEAPVERRGLRHDRRWMLIDADGIFLTQRKLSLMALFDVSVAEDHLEFQRGADSCQVPIDPSAEPVEAEVWGTRVKALSVSPDADAWFTHQLGLPCRLVYMPEQTERAVPFPEAQEGDLVGFADAGPILVASQASIDDLNARLPAPIPIRRFRPNIVVEGCAPYEEDEWSTIQIGDVTLRKVRGCGRCLVTTIDIETATPSDEPLRTLATYRKRGQHVFFGTYYAPDREGPITRGQSIETA